MEGASNLSMIGIAVFEVAVVLWFGLPFVFHHQRCRRALTSWKPPSEAPPSADLLARTTLLLPTWNEASVIERRLENLAGQLISELNIEQTGLNLLLIDSCSNDETVPLARSWLKQNPNAFACSDILVMDQRKGKTAAVNRALHHLRDHGRTRIVVMVDADATCQPGALNGLLSYFHDPEMGAVGGIPERVGATARERAHRQRFTQIRKGEGAMGATPFLEGSLLAFDLERLPEGALDESSNADDAQIAIALAAAGYKTLQHPHAVFVDRAPATVAERARQRVRRARGILRALKRHRHVRSNSSLEQILRFHRHAHMRAPWLACLMMCTMVGRWTTVMPGAWPWTTVVGAILTGLEATGVVLLLVGIFERRLPGFLGGVSTVLVGMLPLIGAWMLEWSGRPAHLWTPVASVREVE